MYLLSLRRHQEIYKRLANRQVWRKGVCVHQWQAITLERRKEGNYPHRKSFAVVDVFLQPYISPKRLKQQIARLLRERPSITLAEVVQQYPLKHGLVELLTYLNLKEDEMQTHIEYETEEKIQLDEATEVSLPQYVFSTKSWATTNQHE